MNSQKNPPDRKNWQAEKSRFAEKSPKVSHYRYLVKLLLRCFAVFSPYPLLGVSCGDLYVSHVQFSGLRKRHFLLLIHDTNGAIIIATKDNMCICTPKKKHLRTVILRCFFCLMHYNSPSKSLICSSV